MAIDFPGLPSFGDVHSSGGRTWTYDGEKWVLTPQPIALDDLSDVDLATVSPVNGDVLTYDGSNWISASVQGGGGGGNIGQYFDAKGDLLVGTGSSTFDNVGIGTDGTFLRANSSASAGVEWASIPTINSLDDIGDVSASTPSSGDFLKWNGSAWVNQQINLGTDTEGNYLSDVIGGTGVSVTHTPAEGSSATIGIGQDVDISASVTFAHVSADITGNLQGNASTASALYAARTIELIGDVSGSASFDGSSNVQISTTVVNDGIELGTNTTGDYVESLVAGTGVTVTNNSGEGSNPTVAIGQDVSTSASVTFERVTANDYYGNFHGSVDGPLSGTLVGEVYGQLYGNVYGNVTGNVSGSASTADALQNPRVISLSGDVSGSVSFDGTQNVSISSVIQPNSVALGTDTTGNYVAEILTYGGSGITASSPGENATIYIGSNATALNSASTIVMRDANGDFAAGTISADLSGNSSTASTLQNARTISLGGDLSGSASFNGSTDVNIIAQVQPNSVALGTDTTGNYVADIVSGTAISVTHTPGEASSASIALNASLNDLNDVVVSAPEEYQTLYYDGIGWVPQYAPLVSYVRNVDTVTLSSGTAVYLFGGTGDHASVKRASNSSEVTSSKTVGLVGSSITVNNNGPVITRGYVDGVDTSLFNVGDALWLGTNGAITNVKPSAPNHLVYIGVVVRANVNGIVYVAAQNGYELEELHNVKINGLTDGQFLRYNSASTMWVNDTINLGTDTDGDYIQSLVAGTGVTLTNNSGEGSTPTVAIGQSVATSASVTFANVTSPLTGNVTGDVTGNVTGNLTGTVTGNASTATALQTARTISLNGDISGSASFDGSQNVTISSTIQPNSVALGTDTTGDYVSSLVAGTGVTLTNNSGESATPTIAIGQPVSTSSSVTFGQLTTTGNIIVGGNLQVSGSVQTINQVSLEIDDPFIYLNGASTSTDPDIGIAGNYNDGIYGHTGFFSDASDGHKWKAFKGYTLEPSSPINTGHVSYTPATIVGNTFESVAANGTAPLSVSSSTVVTNLNADYLDGQHGSYYAPINSPTFTGTVTLPTGTVTSGMILDGTIVNADINSSAAIALSKLASGTAGQVVVGNASGVPTYTTLSGDVTVDSSGVTAIGTGVIVNADINSSAAIAHSKLANATPAQVLLGTTTTGVITATTLSGDVTIDGAGVTAIGSGVIVNADINASAAIDKTKISGTAITAADTGTVTSAMIADGTIVNADINNSAAISLSKLASGTAGQVVVANASGVPTFQTLSGDITVDSAGVATIAANSVALGTDTTGNYMSDVTGGTGVSITHTPGEGSNATIAIGQAVGTSASVTFAAVTAPLIGNVTGNLTGNVSGNATTASTLQTARTISLGGDLSGSASFNGGSDVTISATVQPNSVALGTDTTGNYMSDVSAGTGVSVTHTPGEGSSATIAIGQPVATSSSVTFAAVTAPVIGNASTASTLQTARTISLTGDVSGSVSFNGGSNATISTTIQPDSVALGVDTTGNYMANVVASTGIAITHTPGEGSSASISLSANLDDLSDVSAPSPVLNDVLKWNGSVWTSGSASGGSSVTISDTPPSSPTAGNIWFESDTMRTYVYYDSFWIEIGALSPSAIVSDTAPSAPAAGQIWFNSLNGGTYVYYNSVWTEIGAVPVNALLNTIDSKGDLLVGTADNTVARLGVGTNGQYLSADSTTATGLKWSTVDALPTQTGNSGKYLTTNGTAASWATIVTDVMTDTKNAALIIMDIGV